jgi:hypothetical protein
MASQADSAPPRISNHVKTGFVAAIGCFGIRQFRRCMTPAIDSCHTSFHATRLDCFRFIYGGWP